MFDRVGNLWLGCQREGLLMVPLRPVGFSSWSFQSQGIRLGSCISSVCEGDEGTVWCTVQGVGIYGFNSHGHVVAHPASPDAVEFIFRDKQKRFWVGTDNGLFAYDPLTGRYQQKVTFDCDRFNDMTSDDQGRIYISTFSRGFCIYDPQTGSLRNRNFSERDSVRGWLCNNWIMGMSSDSKGYIWMATSSGISCYDPRKDSFRSQGWNSQLDGVVCFDVCELHRGTLPDGRSLDGSIAIGTEQGLYLYDRQTRRVERFPGSNQLTNKAVCYIVQSNNGDLWCSTSQGVWQYQQSSHSFLGHINGNGLVQAEFLYGVGMHSDDDMVFFGQNDGLTVFQPKNVNASNPSLAPLQLTAFLVSGQGVNTRTVLNGVRITEEPVWQSDHFTLSYLDHTITLCFSQMNFDNPMNVTFEYRVNDGEWIRNTAGVNDFTLSHLQPGTYRIEVRAQQGNQYTPEKVVMVTIRAPWYRTTLAYIVYIVALLSLAVYVFLTYRRHAHEQMNEEKMKFLINATHDIRSPLTLIMSPLANLKRHIGSDQPDALRDIDTIDHNAKRILNLVNQILDVRKIDKQQMQLHCLETDLVTFTQGIYKMFEYNAGERNINFTFTHDADKINVWIDRSQFDKVITNLLSNAFKYSYDGGSVEIRLTHTDKNMILQVIDSGVGLDADNMKHIFDRFYQGGNSRRLHIDGTGIGLNLCKMIVDMHHGTIEAHNRKDEKGSVFEVSLPLGNAHLSANEIEETPAEEEAEVTPVKTASSAKHRVLVVDDDVEIGRYISSELGRYYKFTVCSNGKEGIKELLVGDYDVVVSDVMMPEMDGFTMLRMIKTSVKVSHVPVIMLTSMSDVAHRLEGLERGADAFLAKPFDLEELHMVIENLIQSRQRLKGKYSGAQQQADKVTSPEVKGNDELLMERIMKSVNKNLSNSDFNVDMLTQEVGISRAQLHRKMKELTGISTSEFIRNIRLEQAARLLREQKVNVTQVAYTVGFSNLAHFSTIFRKHFGISPSEYAEQEGTE
jgi:signal transduction histidine kinase/DNA-binding response OmpR family regulator